jgi:predicted Fe-Mo cluster-binding NifX family protein
MTLAIPNWNGRVSPVLDVARRFLVIEIERNAEVDRHSTDIDAVLLTTRFRRILELGVEVLICGAVSRPLEGALLSAGVRVLPQTCGLVEDVLKAYLSGRLADEAFRMPGCRGRCRRRHGWSPLPVGEPRPTGRPTTSRRRGPAEALP